MRRTILSILVTAIAFAGCAGTGTVGYSGTVTATTAAPDLITVSPGVEVIADYDEPIFYADNFYWRFNDGVWYRSNWYTGGWVYASPPYSVLRIERPYAYRHYRPHGYVARRYERPTYQRDYRDRPVVRDHRQIQVRPAPRPVRAAPQARQAPHRAPAVVDRRVRDHRR